MITFLQRVIHRHGRWIFLILLGVIIVAFLLWDYAGASRAIRGAGGNRMLYGRQVSARELDVAKRRAFLNLWLLSGRDMQASERAHALMENQALSRMAMLEEARQLGITAGDEEVIGAARQFFMDKNRQYDASSYSRFVNEVLLPRRLSEGDFEVLVRENIILRKLTGLIASTVKVTLPQVAASAVEISEKLTVSACRFELNDYMNRAKPGENDFIDFYRRSSERFRTPEKVRVAYVAFPIQVSKVALTDQEVKEFYEAKRSFFTTPDGKVKPLKEIAETLRRELAQKKALQEAGKRATEFTVQLVGEEGKPLVAFDALAKQYGLGVKETGFFGSNELVRGIAAPGFTAAAFTINADNPVSEPVPSDDVVYVLKFLDKKDSLTPPFDQVKEAVKNSWIAETALKMAREEGEKKRRQLIELLEKGRPFEQAAGILKVRFQTFKGFSAADPPPEDPYERMVHQVSFLIPAGAVGDFTPNASGGFFIYVNCRQRTKPEDLSKLEPQIQQLLIQTQQQLLLQDFYQAVMNEAGVPPNPSELPDRVR